MTVVVVVAIMIAIPVTIPKAIIVSMCIGSAVPWVGIPWVVPTISIIIITVRTIHSIAVIRISKTYGETTVWISVINACAPVERVVVIPVHIGIIVVIVAIKIVRVMESTNT